MCTVCDLSYILFFFRGRLNDFNSLYVHPRSPPNSQNPLAPTTNLSVSVAIPTSSKTRPPPPSTASTVTYVNSSSSASAGKGNVKQLAGTKRRRDESKDGVLGGGDGVRLDGVAGPSTNVDKQNESNSRTDTGVDMDMDMDTSDPRPTTRPRTSSYTAPNHDPPTSSDGGISWGWFWLPWETFKRGFREGLWGRGGGEEERVGGGVGVGDGGQDGGGGGEVAEGDEGEGIIKGEQEKGGEGGGGCVEQGETGTGEGAVVDVVSGEKTS